MIKVKKSLSLLIIFLFILSNAAYAQYSDPSLYEGKPIEESREGKDYYREGQVIIYPAQVSSKEKQMMERFRKGELSEDEMRAMAKAKTGDKFSEMEFQKGMLEFTERMDRKEAFSYEHKGFGQMYYESPSYEGYSKEHMIYGRIFEYIDDEIDPREIKQNCDEPSKIADITITKLKEKVGDLQKVCVHFEDNEAKCTEMASKSCSQLGTAILREDATETEKIQSVAYSCPANKDAIIQACKSRNKLQMQQRMEHISDSCAKRFDFEGERLIRECEKFKQSVVCDKEKHINQCMGGIKKEDFEKPICPAYPTPQCTPDTTLKTKADANGCIFYYCEATQQCPIPATPQCSSGQVLQKKVDDKRCIYYYCETQVTNICPEPTIPTCKEGETLQKKTDDKGCAYYYCESATTTTITCPSIQKLTCNADETLQTYYDNARCVTSYQCIKQQATCPQAPSKPTCSEGQSLTTRVDDKGCIVGYECVTVTSKTHSDTTSITGQAVLNTYEDFLRNCEVSWLEQQRMCLNAPNVCDKEAFIEQCKEQEQKNSADFTARIEKHCETDTISEIRHAEERCARIDEDRKRCVEHSAKRCGEMKGLAEKCKELMTEEKLRNFMIEEARKRCKFTDIIQDEEDIRKAEKAEIVLAVLNTATEGDLNKLKLFVDDLHEDLELQDTTVYKGTINPNMFGDIKLLPFVLNAKISAAASSERAKEVKAKIVARQKIGEAASKLVSLRDSDVPSEYLYIIEDKASDVLDVSDELGEFEKKEDAKGFGYKMKLFFGLAKQAEQEEINQLENSKSKLQNSIETLTKLIDEMPSDVAKAILKEQVDNLKNQHDDIEDLIDTKEKKAKGWFGIFG